MNLFHQNHFFELWFCRSRLLPESSLDLTVLGRIGLRPRNLLSQIQMKGFLTRAALGKPGHGGSRPPGQAPAEKSEPEETLPVCALAACRTMRRPPRRPSLSTLAAHVSAFFTVSHS